MNEIDHFLINDLLIVKDITTLSRFEFSSDHRITGSHIQIGDRIKIKNYYKQGRKKEKGNYTSQWKRKSNK